MDKFFLKGIVCKDALEWACRACARKLPAPLGSQ